MMIALPAAAGYAAVLGMGVVLGLLGAGGGILTVPILVYLFAMEPVSATAHSLFIVGIAAFAGFLAYRRRGQVSVVSGLQFGLPALAGILCARTVVLPMLPEVLYSQGEEWQLTKPAALMTLFALLMLAAAFFMLRPRRGAPEAAIGRAALAARAFMIGVLTGLVGAGGGFLMIPALIAFARLPVRTAMGTSLMIIAMNSVIGFLADVAIGNAVDWQFLIGLAALAVGGIMVGSRLSVRIAEARLKAVFAVFVALLGFSILIDQILLP